MIDCGDRAQQAGDIREARWIASQRPSGADLRSLSV
jgi:hypothetical protein